MYTQDGLKVDAVFSYKAIGARIVLSPIIIGTTATILKVISKQATQIYRS